MYPSVKWNGCTSVPIRDATYSNRIHSYVWCVYGSIRVFDLLYSRIGI
jgi:hypothetical protein